MSFLKLRYNIDSKYHGFTKTITLPSSRTCVNMICNDAGAMVRSLITDPRVRDEDYLFFDDDDLFAGPPLNFDYLGDINTGLSYRETYRRRSQILPNRSYCLFKCTLTEVLLKTTTLRLICLITSQT